MTIYKKDVEKLVKSILKLESYVYTTRTWNHNIDLCKAMFVDDYRCMRPIVLWVVRLNRKERPCKIRDKVIKVLRALDYDVQ